MKRTAIKKILLVQGGLGDSVGPVLEQHGYRVAWVRTAKNALSYFEKDTPALVIIDVPSLRVSAERLCQGIKRMADVPIIMIGPEQPTSTANASSSASNSLAPGNCADAYLPRPLQLRRLLTRVDKLMPEGQAIELRCGDLVFRPADGVLRKKSEQLYLNPKLSKLLQLFMQQPGEILTRKFLMQQVWDTSYLGDTRTLDVHIRWLREAIEDDPTDPVYLRTVRRQGYRFETPKMRKL
ncbi:MAG: response regulator transcription factor [Chloroflexi bacterium]|nr:response regulator transcription factor [Chloroflexota bacterium]